MLLQYLIVAFIVAAAAFYVARRLFRDAQGHSDGACDKCGKNVDQAPPHK